MAKVYIKVEKLILEVFSALSFEATLQGKESARVKECTSCEAYYFLYMYSTFDT